MLDSSLAETLAIPHPLSGPWHSSVKSRGDRCSRKAQPCCWGGRDGGREERKEGGKERRKEKRRGGGEGWRDGGREESREIFSGRV